MPHFSEKRRSFISVSPIAVPFYIIALFFRFSALTLLAALLHELGHIVAIRITGGKILRIKILPIGAEIDALPAKSYLTEAFICGAGIASNILFAALSFSVIGFSDFFICSLSIAAVNALPILGLDGGDLLLCILQSRLDPHKAHAVLSVISFIFLMITWIISVYIFFCIGGSPLLLFLDVYLFMSTFLSGK